ncbi:hypothetical protein HDR61_00860 [bacterium]|nr:hypothetical protein [bacterium]
MRIRIRRFYYIFCIFAAAQMTPVMTRAAGIMSQHGQIQNVQNYSTNPFWSPDAPYNQRMPAPVYVTGPDVKDDDCQTVVASLVAAQCVARNNCANTRLTDIRPAIMMDLARLPGHNFATACAGYIDGAFNDYKNNNAYSVQPSAFPTNAQPVQEGESPTFNIKNPYAPQTPKWKQDMQERDQELKKLQAANGNDYEKIAKADFPQTINDISFMDRMNNEYAGYAPLKDTKSYLGIKVESEKDALERQKNKHQAGKELFCRQNPKDPECSPQQDDRSSKEKIVQELASAFKKARQ